MVGRIYLDDRLLIQGRGFGEDEALREKSKRVNCAGNFHKYWEIFTWGSENRFNFCSEEEGYALTRIEVSVSDISAGKGFNKDFPSVNLEHPTHSLRVHSYGLDAPAMPISQKSMMMVVRELENAGILCLLHHKSSKDFKGWVNSVDYVSGGLREKMGDKYANPPIPENWPEGGPRKLPIEL